MQIGMIGLGRMGANMVRRLRSGGHTCIVHDVSAEAVAKLAGEGIEGTADLRDFVSRLQLPRVVWLMVPAAFVDSTLDRIIPLLGSGDTVIDGGNSYYRGSRARKHRSTRRARRRSVFSPNI